jgi:hypothetical protein
MADAEDIYLSPVSGFDEYDESKPLKAFIDAIDAAGIPGSVEEAPPGYVRGPVSDVVVPLAQVVIPALGGVLVGWLKGHASRKVFVRIGEVHLQASTADEVEQILEVIAAYQAATAAKAKPRTKKLEQ